MEHWEDNSDMEVRTELDDNNSTIDNLGQNACSQILSDPRLTLSSFTTLGRRTFSFDSRSFSRTSLRQDVHRDVEFGSK